MTEQELYGKILGIMRSSVFDPDDVDQRLKDLYTELTYDLLMSMLDKFSKRLEVDGSRIIEDVVDTLKQNYRAENKTNGVLDKLKNYIIIYILSNKGFLKALKQALLLKLHREMEKLIKERIV